MESKKKLDSISIPRYISIGDFCSEDVKDPLYVEPVYMTESSPVDVNVNEETLLSILISAQEEMKRASESGDQRHSSVHEESTEKEALAQAMGDISGMNLPKVTSSSDGRQKFNSPVRGEESQPDDEERRNCSPDSTKRKSPSSSGPSSPETMEECDSNESLKKRKLEERLKCRGGSSSSGELAQNTHGLQNNRRDECFDKEEESGESISKETASGAISDANADTTEQSSYGTDSESFSNSSNVNSVSTSTIPENGINIGGGNTMNQNSNNKTVSSQSSSLSDRFAKDSSHLPPIEEQGSEEDIDNKILCGKRLCDFTEFDLQTLDISGLNENETLLYAQALSRIEYQKEAVPGLSQIQSMDSSIHAYCNPAYDNSQKSGLTGESSYLEGSDSSGERVHELQNLSLNVETSSLSSISIEQGCSRTTGRTNNKCRTETDMSFDQTTFSERESDSGLSAASVSKVPDMFETSFNTSFRDIASFHDDDAGMDEGSAKSGIASSIARSMSLLAGPQIRLEHCIFCSAPISDGQCTRCDSGRGDFGCVPNGEGHFNVEDEKISEDVFTAADELPSKTGVLSDKGNKNMEIQLPSKTVKSPYFQEDNSRFIWTHAGSLPSPSKKSDREVKVVSSGSSFQKPKQDMFMTSPSKTKNLVKTRDYSRLKSPIASPRKKPVKISPPKKTPAANKQLIFPENEKVSEKVTDNHLNPLTVAVSSEISCFNFRNNKNFEEEIDDVEGLICNVVDNGCSTVEQADTTQSDSSHVSVQSGEESQSYRSSKHQNLITSTPITSTQETFSKNFQQPLHISVTHAAVQQGSGDSVAVKSTACQSVGTSVCQSKSQIVPGCSESSPRTSKTSRSLSVSFAAAEEKENSGDSSEEDKSRRKRISHIESGDADCSYRLVGIVNHHGESLFAGHYTSYSFNLRKQKWFYLDDKHTRETFESTVRRESMCNGYVFFYMDKNLFDSFSNMKDDTVATKQSPDR